MKTLAIINGPNLNMLGTREPEIYGYKTLNEIKILTEEALTEFAPWKSMGYSLGWFQSNLEGELVERLQGLTDTSHYAGLVINPGAYSHYSWAIYDALKMLSIPVVEVHLSNVFRREEGRQNLLTAKGAHIIMSGLGEWSYYFAVCAITRKYYVSNH